MSLGGVRTPNMKMLSIQDLESPIYLVYVQLKSHFTCFINSRIFLTRYNADMVMSSAAKLGTVPDALPVINH